jgi:hypothetical protein
MRPGFTLSSLLAIALATSMSAQALAQAESPALEKGIALFKNLDDEQAATVLRRFLLDRPEAHEQALAHLYLGLIALNVGDQQLAREEFAETVSADPTVDVPPSFSPKAQLLLDDVRRHILREERARRPPPPLVAAPLIVREGPPPAAVTAPEPEAQASSPSHAPAWVTGSIAVAALGTGIAMGLLQQSVNGQAVQAADAGQAASLANQGATYGLAADIAYGVSGAAAIACVVLIVTEAASHSEGRPSTPFSVAWGPGGAGLMGHF